MSEIKNKNSRNSNFRWQLLATVSAMALAGFVCGIGKARAADTDEDRPTVWIELGGQLSRLNEEQESFLPAAMEGRPSIFSMPQKFERQSLYSIDEYGSVSFEPDGTDWVLSATVRYGRSVNNRHVHQQTAMPATKTQSTYLGGKHAYYLSNAKFADTRVSNGESHLVLDFQAGKDIGLGLFGGKSGSSVLNVGIRFAQFSSKSNIALKSDPDWHRGYKYFSGQPLPKYVIYHSNTANLIATRNFHGVGPSLSWNASAPLIGESKSGELALDWGINAAVLFGKQRVAVHHQTTSLYNAGHSFNCHQSCLVPAYPPISTNHVRVRTVTVPNVGGFAGMSYRIESFKVSAGYRADFFFGAMDGGNDTARKETVGFLAPSPRSASVLEGS